MLYHGILLSARFCSRFKLVITQRVPMFDAKGYSSPCHFPALTTHNGAERIRGKKNSDNEGTKSTRAPPVMYGIVLETIILQPGGEQCLQLDQVC